PLAGVGFSRRQRHEAAQAQPRHARDGAGECGYVAFRDPGLLLLAARVDLDEHVQRRGVMWALLVEARGELLAVERVDPRERLCDGARLVRLQPTDEMPNDVEPGERVDLRQRLLHVTFAEVALTGAVGRFDRGCRLSFADRH